MPSQKLRPVQKSAPGLLCKFAKQHSKTDPALEIRINVHGQAHEHKVCKNAYFNKAKIPPDFCGS